MRVLVARGRRVSLLPIRERSKRLLVHVGSRIAAIRAKDRSGLLVRLGRWWATIVSSLDISRGISPRDKDPRVSGQRSIFLHTPVQARRASINFRELHGHLPLHKQAKGTRLWADAEDEAHRQGRQGFRGVTPRNIP